MKYGEVLPDPDNEWFGFNKVHKCVDIDDGKEWTCEGSNKKSGSGGEIEYPRGDWIQGQRSGAWPEWHSRSRMKNWYAGDSTRTTQ